MNIACLGWGSLISDPRTLPVRPPWNPDGPWLPVEFARHSSGGRVTLVLVSGAQAVPTLWALLNVTNVPAAREALREREETALRDIGFWSAADRTEGETSRLIGAWAEQRNLYGVVWTALPPKWNGQDGVVPSLEQVLELLSEQGTGSEAERYVRKAPSQVRTAYRTRIEAKLGWTHTE